MSDAFDERLARFERKAARERAARQEAERLLEDKARALYEANQALRAHQAELEQRVEARTLALRHALELAERASAAKTTFLAHMSHELRTPLMAILGHADDLRQETGREEVEVVHRNAEHLLSLINEVLDLSKVESGTLELAERPTDLALLWHDLRTTFAVRARERGLDWVVEVPEHPTWYRVDPLRLKQVLINLLSNALRYTERGTVRLTVTMPAVDRLRVSVHDTGPGIPTKAVADIFEPFVQAHADPGRGTGLGLSIAHRLAHRMGGDLRLTSSDAEGTCFVLDVPVVPEQVPETTRPPVRSLPRRPLDGVSVLIADDAPDSLELLKRWCERAGARVTTAGDGASAVQSYRDHDIVLMDMQMPVMDGLAATRELRRRGADVPVLALTANTMVSDREAALEAGCDAFLGKPVARSRLMAEIARWTVGLV